MIFLRNNIDAGMKYGPFRTPLSAFNKNVHIKHPKMTHRLNYALSIVDKSRDTGAKTI